MVPADTSGSAACLAASRRVPGRVIPNACVGPPTTTSSTSLGIWAGARLTSTRSVRTACDSPSATAPAICLVLPNIDSNTTSARMTDHPFFPPAA